MKKITLLFFSLLITVVGFSQTEILNVAFDTALPTELRNNTDPTFISETSLTWSGTSGNPSGSMSASGVVDEANGTAVGRAFQFLYEDAAFDFGSSGSLSISFDIKIDAAIVNANLQFQTQVSKVGGGVVVVNNENIQNSVPFGEWTNLQFDMTPVPSEFDTNGNLLIFFWNLASAPIGGSGGAFEVDNIVITASDPPDPTCDDGVQNGNETGVDCGGPDCPECISDPTVSADVPIQDPTGVLSVYSETYAGGRVAAPLASVTNFNFLAFNGSGSYTEVDIESNGNLTGKIVDLSFYGAQWDAVDVSSYTYVHIDYYATT